MIKYTATSQQGRLEPGVHFATITSAIEAYSAKGDQTIEMELTVGKTATMKMRDTLYNSERAAWRITQARNCFGFADEEGDTIEFAAADFVGCTGYVELAMGAPKTSGKHEGKSFLELKRYMPRDYSPSATPAPANDNIPF
jgi:hypothetical protein